MTIERCEGPTKFKPELWTIISDQNGRREHWAVIMLDGPEAGQPCAFGGSVAMAAYAQSLNETEGRL
jgi:hypothetical protein